MFVKKQTTIDSDSETEKEDVGIRHLRSPKPFTEPVDPKLEVPFAVQGVINKIKQAQHQRAREVGNNRELYSFLQ